MASGSFTCRKSTTWYPRLYFSSKGSHTQDFYALKKIHRSQLGLNPRTSDPVASMITTGPLRSTLIKEGGSMGQAVRCSHPTTQVLILCLYYFMWVSWWKKWSLSRFFSGFLQFFPYHKFHSRISPLSSQPFHFISLCDGATGVVGRHPRYPLTFNIGTSSHLIPRPGCIGYELRIFILY